MAVTGGRLTSLAAFAALLAGCACSVPRHARCPWKSISLLAARYRPMSSLAHLSPPQQCLVTAHRPHSDRACARAFELRSMKQEQSTSSQQAHVALPKMGPLVTSRRRAKLMRRGLVPCPAAARLNRWTSSRRRARRRRPAQPHHVAHAYTHTCSGKRGPLSAAGAGRTGPSNAARPTTHCFQLVARRTVPCTSLPEPQAGHQCAPRSTRWQGPVRDAERGRAWREAWTPPRPPGPGRPAAPAGTRLRVSHSPLKAMGMRSGSLRGARRAARARTELLDAVRVGAGGLEHGQDVRTC